MNVQAFYESMLPLSIDIAEHLPTLTKLASGVTHVTEFGVRDGASTLAFIMGAPNTLHSYDINPCKNKPMLEQAAKTNGVSWVFHLQDDCKEPIEETELLLIDTIHEHFQLEKELYLHGNKARQFIVMHDTHQDPPGINGHSSEMWVAILQFLAINRDWRVFQDYTNCNGLTILARAQYEAG